MADIDKSDENTKDVIFLGVKRLAAPQKSSLKRRRAPSPRKAIASMISGLSKAPLENSVVGNAHGTNQWKNKIEEFEKMLNDEMKTKNEKVDLMSLDSTKNELEKVKEDMLKCQVNTVPDQQLLLIAKIVENRSDTLTGLTEIVRTVLFPGLELTPGEKLNLTETSKSCPLSLLTVREAILKVASRKEFGCKKSFSKNKNESEDSECGWHWKMKKYMLDKLPKETARRIKIVSNVLYQKSKKMRALKNAIKLMSEEEDNLKKILPAIDAVSKTNLKYNTMKKNLEKTKEIEKEKVNSKSKIKTEESKHQDTVMNKSKTENFKPPKKSKPKSHPSSRSKTKKTTPKNIIFEYFETVKSQESEVEKEPNWYKSWQAPENSTYQSITRESKEIRLDFPKEFKVQLSHHLNFRKTVKRDENIRIKPMVKRIKFRCFFEDYRPSFLGSFSERPFSLNGRRPLKRDNSLFDYDYDSEAEWGEEPEDADEIGSEDEVCIAEEEDLNEKGLLRPDGLIQDEFLASDSSNAPRKDSNTNRRVKELIPEYYFQPNNKNEKCPSNEEEHKAANALSRYKSVFLKSEILDKTTLFLAQGPNTQFCDFSSDPGLLKAVEKNQKQRLKALDYPEKKIEEIIKNKALKTNKAKQKNPKKPKTPRKRKINPEKNTKDRPENPSKSNKDIKNNKKNNRNTKEPRKKANQTTNKKAKGNRRRSDSLNLKGKDGKSLGPAETEGNERDVLDQEALARAENIQHLRRQVDHLSRKLSFPKASVLPNNF